MVYLRSEAKPAPFVYEDTPTPMSQMCASLVAPATEAAGGLPSLQLALLEPQAPT